MLRNSIAPSRRLGSPLGYQGTTGQWIHRLQPRRAISQKSYYRARAARSPLERANRAFISGLPNTNSGAATFTTSTNLRAPKDPNVRPPASPSSDSVIAPESALKTPPSPISATQTSPGTSVNPPEATKGRSDIPPPPPPPQPKPKRRFRRFLTYLILTSGLAYGGGVFLSLKSDNFHDFFTEYVPYGEEAVLYLEDMDFRRRFPNATRNVNRKASEPREEGTKVTIPSKSGVSWKVSEEEEKGSDVSRRGKHMSAIESAESTVAVEKSKPAIKKAEPKPERSPAPETTSETKTTPVKQDTQESSNKAPIVTLEQELVPAIASITNIDPLTASIQDDPTVQELAKIVNDLIAVINADGSSSKLSGPVRKAKDEFYKLGEKIANLRHDAHAAAQEDIRNAHAEFDRSATELIRRIDEVRAEEATQFREEYETEREKLAQSYREKIQTELDRANEIAEQRLRNELVEQSIELNRKFLGDVENLVEREREGRLSKLAELASNVQELEKLTVGWNDVIDANLATQKLQVAIDAVRTALESDDVPRPFINELVAVKGLAAQDPIVDAAVSSISPDAYQRGIPSSTQIIDRFRRVANEVRKASLLPENAGVASHATSYLMSKVMFKKETSTDGDSVESILTRTENYLEEGNLDGAAREMNSLRGWSRLLSKDWLADVRRVLEVKQALEVSSTPYRTTLALSTERD
ncbi:Formation of crista junctions protein 1 [Myotisia sp. PD_48]|nr:Formation of crista junctions protein 1 [Myotisia sp. PD_48]